VAPADAASRPRR